MSNSPGKRVLPPIVGIIETKRAAISSVIGSPSSSTKTMQYSNSDLNCTGNVPNMEYLEVGKQNVIILQ
jgi:hypothetical protein